MTKIKKIKLVQIASTIGRKKDQTQTLIGLGLGKISACKILVDSQSIRGMVNKVKHLITVEEV